jgi:hypothetical protein
MPLHSCLTPASTVQIDTASCIERHDLRNMRIKRRVHDVYLVIPALYDLSTSCSGKVTADLMMTEDRGIKDKMLWA